MGGYSWRAEMCLACQQRSTRKLRVIKALELRRGNRWNGDEWFQDLQVNVRNGGEYGISRNRDQNELESTLAKAILSGLNCYEQRDPVASTEDAADDAEQEARAEVMDTVPKTPPAAEAQVPRPKDLPSGQDGPEDRQPPPPPLLAARSKEKSKGKGHGSAAAENKPEGAPQQSEQRPRSREGSFHSARSEAREERMMVLEQAVFNMNDLLVEIQQALRPELRSTGLRGPTPQDGPQEVDRPSFTS